MCDRKILTPWPGHTEVCGGMSHSYVEEMQSPLSHFKKAMVRVTPEMFGEKLDGVFHAICPDLIMKSYDVAHVNDVPVERVDQYVLERRRLVDEFFYYRDQTFENYNSSFNGHAEDVKVIEKFMRTEHLKRLILKGEVGRGKSHLAMACVNSAKGLAVMLSSSRFYQMLRETESYDSDEFAEKALSRLRHANVIAIDDLGVEKQTETQVFNLGMKDLLESFEGKLIITTNLSERDMENIYGQKIVSRIYESAVMVVLKGRDYRRGA